MALRDTTFTYKQTRRRASTTTARAYTLNSRQMELDRKSAGDIKRMADTAEKRLKALDTIRKKGVLPFTRQEMELEYRRLDDQIWFLTNQAENLRNVGGQADQIIAIEKLISILTEHQNDIREIVNANIPFQNNIIKDVIGHTGYFLRQRAIVDPYKRVVAKVGGAVRANSLGGVVLRSIIGAGLNRGAPVGALRMAAGLSRMASGAYIKKLNERRANTASPLDLLNRATSRKYKDVDTATAYNLEKAKLNEAKKQHKENKDQTEESNKIGEEAVEELKKANKTAEKMVREFKSQDGGGGLLESVGGALATMFGFKTGGKAAGAAGAVAKGGSFLGRWGKRLGYLGVGLSVADLAFNKRDDGSKRAFFGEKDESFLDSRAASYGEAALAGFTVGGPWGAGIALLSAFVADNWRGIREFQKEQNEELLKTFGVLPKTLTEALDNSELGKFMSNDAKLRMIEAFGTPVEKMIAKVRRTANELVEYNNQNRTKYPKGIKTYTDMNGNIKVFGPNNEDLGIFDHRRISRDLTQEEAAANVQFTQRPATTGISYKPVEGSGISSRETRAMNYFMEQGYTQEQASGIVGNLIQESNLNPNGPRGDGGTAHGMAQWRKERLINLKRFAKNRNGSEDSWTDEQTQLEFIKWELENTYSGANKALLKAKNHVEATDAIALYYESPKGAETGIANNIHGINNRRAQAGRMNAIKFEPVTPVLPTYDSSKIITGQSNYLEGTYIKGSSPDNLVSYKPTDYLSAYKSRDVKSDLDYFGDDRSLQFNPAPSREPYNIPTFESPGVTPKYEPGNSPVVVPVADNTATPSTKKDTAGSNFPVYKQTTYGMPVLNDIPILDTEMGVLLMTKQAG